MKHPEESYILPMRVMELAHCLAWSKANGEQPLTATYNELLSSNVIIKLFFSLITIIKNS